MGCILRKKIKILLIHLCAIGDFVTTTAAIREIRRIYPNSEVMILCSPIISDLVQYCPYVDKIATVPVPPPADRDFPQTYAANLAIAKFLLKYRFDIAFAFEFTGVSSTALLAYMSGAKERVSSIRNFHRIFAPLLTVPVNHYTIHAADTAIDFPESILHAPIVNRKLELWFSPADFEVIKRIPDINNLYAVCPGAGRVKYHWPVERWPELIRLIIKAEKAAFVILGGPKEMTYGEKIRSLANSDHVVDLTGKLNLRQTGAILKFAKFCLTNNTGTMHMAAAVGTPVLSTHLSSADIQLKVNDLERWYPYGVPSVTVRPKHGLSDCENSTNWFGCTHEEPHCIAQITPKAMFEGLQILKERVAKHLLEPYYYSDWEPGDNQ